MRQAVCKLLAYCLILGTLGCSGEQGNRKPTTPVSGRITVDGSAPGSPVRIECHPVAGMDTANPSVSQCYASEDGSFSISTYESGDGVPAGDYVLTFFWGEMNLVSMSYGGKDKLNDRYSSVENSPKKFSVNGEESLDLGVIALTSK